MKKLFIIITAVGLLSLLLPLSKVNAQSTPLSKVISNELARKDSLFFNAIYACELGELDNFLSKDFVFYHDNGLNATTTSQSLTEFRSGIQKNFCDKGIKLDRHITDGSLQVIMVNEQKAMQTGVQRFFMQGKLMEESKFSRVWQKEKGEWKMTQEMDYLTNTKMASKAGIGNTLYNEIAHMDSVLFNAFNARDAETIRSIFDESLEFYHDKGGLTNYTQNIAASRNLFAQNNGLNRKLVEGSMEVYPVNNYGAIQVGTHTFCHKEGERDDCGTFKFMHIWKKKDGVWKITRVASYDH